MAPLLAGLFSSAQTDIPNAATGRLSRPALRARPTANGAPIPQTPEALPAAAREVIASNLRQQPVARPLAVSGIATTTSLSPSTSTLTGGSVLTLTSTVNIGNHAGQVAFCDLGTGTTCNFLHILATKRLVSGSAIYRLIPSVGIHIYQAVFLGTGANTLYASSTSPAVTVTVTGNNDTTALTSSGSQGNYTLSATVTGKRPSVPTGTVTFTNQTGNTVVTSRALASSTNSTTTLTPGTTTLSSSLPVNIAVADFNNDGVPDTAIVNPQSNTVSLYLGVGTGAFRLAQIVRLASSEQPSGLAIGDFNNDGSLDLATTVASLDGTYTEVQLLFGSSTGTFIVGNAVRVGNNAFDVQAADFNHDGNLDLAVLDNYYTVYLLAGSGTGTFGSAAATPVGITPVTSLVADFNNDGIPDLAYVGRQNVYILLGGNGAITLQPSSILGVPYPVGLTAGDLNGDGYTDLAVSDANNLIYTYKGSPNGTLTSSGLVQLTFSPQAIAAGDFTGDGLTDLAVASYDTGAVALLKGTGQGSFSPYSSTATSALSNIGLVAADLNGDGIPDVAYSDALSHVVGFLLGGGSSSASVTVNGISPVGKGTQSIVVTYAGDSHFGTSTSSAVGLQGQDATATAVTSVSPSTIQYGAIVNFSATVQDTTNTGTYPTGSVYFTDSVAGGTNPTYTIALFNGKASVGIGSPAVGTHTVTATYAPNSSAFSASQDTTGMTYTVTRGNLTPTSGNYFTVKQGGSTIISIIVDYPGAVAPNCAITVLVNGSASGIGTPTCVNKTTGTGPHRNCSFPYTDSLAPGKYPITFSQAGDANYNPSPTASDTLYVTGVSLAVPTQPSAR